MASESSAFYLLDERIQRFIWTEGWEALRDVQENAIPLIVTGDQDVIVAAATAAGKTEAAFFPALTHIVHRPASGLIIYISPLKALINDQFGRLDRLCEQLEVSVWPWHGDISSSQKMRFLKKREGVLLITPESLEALLCNRGSQLTSAFERLAFFVVDELHAFIGSERGKQLQSLMHRIEGILRRRVPRIGLSATLGDMNLAKQFLRPGDGGSVQLVESRSTGGTLMVQLKGYEEPDAPPKIPGTSPTSEKDEDPVQQLVAPGQLAVHLFENLRGANNLVFPNSKRQVEFYTHRLNQLCEQHQVPNEFWPHHGSLSKELRADTEAALKQKEMPASAVCTNTLELGIDIGAVRSVAQIGPPHTVASLRQRLGRSGRRKGEPAILRGYVVERELGPKSLLMSRLRWETVQMIAMISLLAEGWFEPPRVHGAHFSTLVQQLLSVIAQESGMKIGRLYNLLCGPKAPFPGVSTQEFIDLVRHLGKKKLVIQESSGELLPGSLGEKFINHYQFYAAFTSEEEYRVVAGGRTLGTLPVKFSLRIGERILFGAKTWRVEEVDDQQKIIYVSRTSGGVPPPFSDGAGGIHRVVRDRMRQLYQNASMPSYLDKTAQRFLIEGRRTYTDGDLATANHLPIGRDTLLTTWMSDAGNEALACFLMRRGFEIGRSDLGVLVIAGKHSVEGIFDALIDAGSEDAPDVDVLLEGALHLEKEKWDWALPISLLRKTFSSQNLDVTEALQWIRAI